MKRIFNASVAGIVICLLLIASLVSAVAAPETTSADLKTTVNGVEASVGSTVEYTLNIADTTQDIVGLQLFFQFDQDVLELVDAKTDNFKGGVINKNANNDGLIYMNHSDLEGVNCAEKTPIVTLSFNVVGEGETEITYFIQYLYDFDTVNIYNYTLSYDLAVDGAVEAENKAPVLADPEDVFAVVDDDENFDFGDFANNQSATGSGEKEAPSVNKFYTGPTSDKGNLVGNNDADENNDSDDDNGADYTILYVIGGIVVAILIVVIVINILNNKKKNQNQNTTDSDSDE